MELVKRSKRRSDSSRSIAEDEIDLPSSKKTCQGLEGPERCSTPIPSPDHNEEHVDLNDQSFESFIDEVEDEQEAALSDGIGLNNESFESFIDEVEEEQDEIAAQELSQHGLDDQSFSDFLQDVAEDPQTKSGSVANGMSVSIPTAILNGLVFPKEVLENILSRLSLVDLYTSARFVCRLWNSVVSAESFVRWKWMYYKSQDEPSVLPSFIHENTASFLLDIAKFVQKEFSQITAELKHILQKHPQYSCVPHLLPSSDKPALTDVGELALLVACCNSVHHLLHLVHLLSHPVEGGFSSPVLSYSEISEILYCMATFFRETSGISPRFHYNLFYVLDVMERRCEVHVQSEEHDGDGVLASATKLTDEQLKIVNHKFQPGQTVKVLALAGTGKTTTLYHIVRANRHLNFLYCVFNKSVQQHAESSIFAGCSNVIAKTFHSVAYSRTARRYKDNSKLGSDLNALFISWNITTRDAHWKTGNTFLSLSEKLSLAKCVKDTLDNYLASADDVLGHQHVVDTNKTDEFPSGTVLMEAKNYWSLMQSTREKKIKMTHDGYLKLFQLTKPTRLHSYRYEVILVDEAQDLTPAIIDLLVRQEAPKVFVGDPNQQIYSFRGASNALNQITSTHTYHLTRSFRFGPEISYVCDLALTYFKPEKAQTLIGTLNSSNISGLNTNGQRAVICRMNATLFDEVVSVLTGEPNARIGFAGVSEESDLNSKYGFELIEEIAALQEGADVKTLKTPELRYGCKSFNDLLHRAAKSRDMAMLSKIKVCQKYTKRIPSLIRDIKSRVIYDLAMAAVVFTTAHKSKGLEFETVIVADDYNAEFTMEIGGLFDFEDGELVQVPGTGEIIEVEEDERNLIYVAMSRAKKHLVMSPTILDVLHKKERFLYPIISPEDVCITCKEKTVFLLEKPSFNLSTKSSTTCCKYCKKCCPETL